jgi:hypothetical protein
MFDSATPLILRSRRLAWLIEVFDAVRAAQSGKGTAPSGRPWVISGAWLAREFCGPRVGMRPTKGEPAPQTFHTLLGGSDPRRSWRWIPLDEIEDPGLYEDAEAAHARGDTAVAWREPTDARITLVERRKKWGIRYAFDLVDRIGSIFPSTRKVIDASLWRLLEWPSLTAKEIRTELDSLLCRQGRCQIACSWTAQPRMVTEETNTYIDYLNDAVSTSSFVDVETLALLAHEAYVTGAVRVWKQTGAAVFEAVQRYSEHARQTVGRAGDLSSLVYYRLVRQQWHRLGETPPGVRVGGPIVPLHTDHEIARASRIDESSLVRNARRPRALHCETVVT